MRYQRNLVGNKYGKLLVIKSLGHCRPGNGHYLSLVRCDCGYEFEIYDTHLVNDQRTQCPICSNNDKKIHGMTNTSLFHVWSGMRGRCNNPNNNSYSDYGGRGIKVCEEWDNDFVPFMEWALSHGYKQGLTIDRIDNDGNYEPSNCRWADSYTQARNKRDTIYADYEGSRLPITEISEITGIKSGTLRYRLVSGWNDYDATHIPENGDYSKSRSKGHEIKHKVIMIHKISNEELLFNSLAAACRYLNKNVGYLSCIMNRIGKEKFEIEDYYVEVKKHFNKVS